MTENAFWSTQDPTPHAPTWSDRFRGAMLGGAVGDALGAGVRRWPTGAIRHWLGSQGVVDYLSPFGRRGAVTDLTQLSVFTLDALLQARATDHGGARRLPTEVVRANHLRWLHTQGVPWECAMAPYLPSHPEPGGWLLERRELFSTRNPVGSALTGLGSRPGEPPLPEGNQPSEAPLGTTGAVSSLVWAAPAMVWSESYDLVHAAGAGIANILTDNSDTQGAAGLHADVLSQLMRGSDLRDAVSASDFHRLGRAHPHGPFPAAARRALYAAMFSAQGRRRPEPATLDAEFDTTDDRPGELGIALVSVACTDTFVDAVLMAVNQSADSSVTGALAGQLAGAVHGPASIPAHWLNELELREIVETLCADATEAFAPPPPPPPLPKWAQRYVTDSRGGFSGPLELEGSDPVSTTAVDSPVLAPYAVTSERVEEDAGITAESELVHETAEEAEVSPTQLLPVVEAFPAEELSDEVPEVSPAEERSGMAPPVEASSIEEAPAESPPSGEFPVEPPTVGPEVTFPAPEDAPPPEPEPETAPTGRSPDTEDASEEVTPTERSDIAASHESDPPEMPSGTEEPELPSAREEPEEPPAVPTPQRSGGGHAVIEDVDTVAPSLTERVLGCFLGGALGDALGADLEFATAEQIGEGFGPDGPTGLGEAYGVHGAITDETQLTLFTAEGLIRGSLARRTLGRADPLPEVQLAYQRWLHTQGVGWDAAAGPFRSDYSQPDGWLICVPGLFSTRAPGKTVLGALDGFGRGRQQGAPEEPVNDSKGCGGVMRAAPAALWSSDPAEAFELGARTAALTHGHPSGYLAAGAFAVIVQQAVLGSGLDDGVWLALQVLETWEGHEETSRALESAVTLAGNGVPTPEQLAEELGGGWVGEQALAIAVCATLAADDDIGLALRIAVHHSGDSDSTGAICGNIIGALVGIAGLPVGWLAELELRDVVEQAAMDYVAEFGLREGDEDAQPPVDEDWNERYPVRALGTGAGSGDALDPPTQQLVAVGRESEQPADDTAAEDEPRQAEPEPEPARPEPATEMVDPDSHQPKPAPRRINNVGPVQWDRPRQDTRGELS